MKEEYDFSNAERGRFYHPDASLKMPLFDAEKKFKVLQDAITEGFNSENTGLLKIEAIKVKAKKLNSNER